MDGEPEPRDPVLRDTASMLAAGCAILGVLSLTGWWSHRTWWACAMDVSGSSAIKTVLLLVLAPIVACGTLLMGLRGEDPWRSARKRRTILYVILTVLAFGGCLVLPGTDVGRELVSTWLV